MTAAGATAAARRPRRAEAAPDAAPRADLQVVAPKPSRFGLRVLGALLCAVAFGIALGLAAFHSVLVQSQLRLDRLNREIAAEQDRQRELRLLVGQLVAPERILAEAQARGMVQPDDRKYLAAIVPGAVVPPPATTRAPAKKTSTAKAAVTTTVPSSTRSTGGR